MKLGTILATAKSLGLFEAARRLTSPAVRILCYHGLWLGNDAFAGDHMFILAPTFARRMRAIDQMGYHVIPLDHAIDGLRGKRTLPAASVVITFDDGWYGSYTGMLPEFRRYGFPATLYCDTEQLLRGGPVPHVMAAYLAKAHGVDVSAAALAAPYRAATDLARTHAERLVAVHGFAAAAGIDIDDYLARRAFEYMTGDELRQARLEGLDLQLHTHRHDLGDFSRAKVTTELEDNRRALGEILLAEPHAFRHFCYPSGEWKAAVAPILDELGVLSSTTSARGLVWPGGPHQAMARLSDGDDVSDLKFEADISGFTTLAKAALARLPGKTHKSPDPVLIPEPQ